MSARDKRDAAVWNLFEVSVILGILWSPARAGSSVVPR